MKFVPKSNALFILSFKFHVQSCDPFSNPDHYNLKMLAISRRVMYQVLLYSFHFESWLHVDIKICQKH